MTAHARRILIRVVCFLTVGVASFGLAAAPITLTMTGTLTAIVYSAGGDFLAGLGFDTGDQMTASFSVDPIGAVDIQPELPGLGNYSFHNSPVTIQLSGHSFLTHGLQIIIWDLSMPPLDAWVLAASTPASSTLPLGLTFADFGIGLQDPTGAVFSGDALVYPPPPLSAFSGSNDMAIRITDGSELGYLIVQVDAVSVSAVPEPSSVLLLVAGGAIMVLALRRSVRVGAMAG